MKRYLVIDIGGINIKYGVIEDETLIAKDEVPTPHTDIEDFFTQLVKIKESLNVQVDGVAISAPGLIDSNTGFMFTAGALGYIANYPMGEKLSELFGLPVTIENDGKCAALAEVWMGSLKGIKHGLVLLIGTGIGGGVVINGQLHRGANFAAGELSSLLTSLTPNADFWARINGVNSLLIPYAKSKDLDVKQVNGRDFFKDIDAKDETAWTILREFCASFAKGIFSVQTVIDAEVVAIGGGISAQDVVVETINSELEKFMSEVPMIPIQKPKVVRCSFANDSNLFGALYHHLELLK